MTGFPVRFTIPTFLLFCGSCAMLKTPIALLDKPNCTPEIAINECHIFVDLVNGSDSGAGTRESPLRTIHFALANQSQLSKMNNSFNINKAIVVSQGNYIFNSSVTAINDNTLRLQNGQVLYGGYDPLQRWRRNVSAYVTSVTDTAALPVVNCGATANCPAIFFFQSPVDNSTIIDGFDLQASLANTADTTTVAIYAPPMGSTMAGPVFNNNTFRGGATVSNSGQDGVVLAFLFASGPKVTNNRFILGTSTGSSAGSKGLIIQNVDNIEITQNVFSGGSATATVSAISINASINPKIQSNTLTLGSGATVRGIELSQVKNASVTQNSITGGAAVNQYQAMQLMNGTNNQLRANQITLGTSAVSLRAIETSLESGIVIDGNSVTSGFYGSSAAAGVFAGIYLSDTDGTVSNNTVAQANASNASTTNIADGIMATNFNIVCALTISSNTLRLDGTNWTSANGITISNAFVTGTLTASANLIYLPSQPMLTGTLVVSGIQVSGTVDADVNLIKNKIYGQSTYATTQYGINSSAAFGGGAPSYTYANNEIYRGGSTGIFGTDAYGIFVSVTTTPVPIFGNYIEVWDAANNSGGIYSDSVQSRIFNNAIIHNSSNSLAAGNRRYISVNVSPPVIPGQVIANNTIIGFNGTNTAGTDVGVYLGINVANSSDQVLNNNLIVLRSNGGGGFKYGMFEAASIVPLDVRSNSIIDLGASGTFYPYIDSTLSCGGSNNCTIALMNSIGPNYSGNISVGSTSDFVNYNGNDFHLAASADANLRYGGFNVSTILTTDLDGRPRTGNNGPLATAVTATVPAAGMPAGLSIGAYETD